MTKPFAPRGIHLKKAGAEVIGSGDYGWMHAPAHRVKVSLEPASPEYETPGVLGAHWRAVWLGGESEGALPHA